MGYLTREDYKLACSLMPIVCIDLFVRDSEGRVLLGWRKNAPAADSWFIPGGRVRKNERLASAFARLCAQELGIQGARIEEAKLRGAYEHFYDTDFTGDLEASSHYVTLAYEVPHAAAPLHLPVEQHEAWRWMREEELLASPHVHDWTKAYFR